REQAHNYGETVLGTQLVPVQYSVGYSTSPADAPVNTLLILFYSGHGVHLEDKDYIIPRLWPYITTVQKPEDIMNWCVSVSSLTQAAEEAAAASVVILDTHFPTVTFDQAR